MDIPLCTKFMASPFVLEAGSHFVDTFPINN